MRVTSDTQRGTRAFLSIREHVLEEVFFSLSQPKETTVLDQERTCDYRHKNQVRNDRGEAKARDRRTTPVSYNNQEFL